MTEMTKTSTNFATHGLSGDAKSPSYHGQRKVCGLILVHLILQ